MPRIRAELQLAVGLALLVTLSGCQTNATRADEFMTKPRFTTNFGKAALMYLPNRVMDFIDIFHFGYGIGPGFGAEVQITRPVSVGAIGGSDVGVAWLGRHTSPFQASAYARANVSEFRFVSYEEEEAPPFDFLGENSARIAAASGKAKLSYRLPSDRELARIEHASSKEEVEFMSGPKKQVWRIPRWDVGIRYHALLDQVYVGVAVNEIADFFAGLILLDLRNDDIGGVHRDDS